MSTNTEASQPPSHSPSSSHSHIHFDDTHSDSLQSSQNLPASHSNHALIRSKSFIVKSVLFVSSALVFSVSLMFAIEHWDGRQHNSIPDWSSHSCKLISNKSQKNPTNSSQFRVIADVEGLGFRNEPVKAYYGPSPDYTLSQQVANQALSPTPSNTTCYVSDEDPPHVSLVDVTLAMPHPSSVYIAWTATFVAAVMGVLLFAFLSHVLNKCMMARVSSPSPQITSPDQVKAPFLTSSQTRFICDNYAEDLRRVDAKDWVCSICLEEDQNDSLLKLVRLPCHHGYHKRCIREWLRKGKSVCPLCNWEAKSLFEKATGPSDSHLEGVALTRELEEPSSTGDDTEVVRNVCPARVS